MGVRPAPPPPNPCTTPDQRSGSLLSKSGHLAALCLTLGGCLSRRTSQLPVPAQGLSPPPAGSRRCCCGRRNGGSSSSHFWSARGLCAVGCHQPATFTAFTNWIFSAVYGCKRGGRGCRIYSMTNGCGCKFLKACVSDAGGQLLVFRMIYPALLYIFPGSRAHCVWLCQ